ncbi:autophagy-related protein 17 [Staphylotrichum tortipilum]|uniref:Autophagy-related protein 17 n=1 Tax=Staphylotrichum tortipilum TaxID=2831512 RepID=A0AAN6RPT6_9PEZI|nr:autophagy-related protein 17 [Staphylotrichum longicolle]
MASPRPASLASPRSHPLSYQDSASPPAFESDDHVSVEVLVRHLLAAKQSLSSMALVLRAHDLATHARQMHEDSVIHTAQTAFLRRLVDDEVRVLRKLRRGMEYTYDAARREFKQLPHTLDAANGRLEKTMRMLQETQVEPRFRPPGEEEKYLMDFVDENSVGAMQKALMGGIAELQAVQTSFDGDLLRFDTDLRLLNEILTAAPAPDSPSSSSAYPPIPHLFASLAAHSQDMAQHLTSLTNHFDMCVKAVRATEGGAALARRRAAEATDDGDDPVSISGIIAGEHEPHADLEPIDPHELAEMVQVVLEDAPEVDEVVAEIQAVLQQMEHDFGALKEQADRIRAAHGAGLAAFGALEEMGERLQGYIAAEHEFEQRWADEKEAIAAKLEEMDGLRRFYEGYASAYGSLLLEAERRRAVEDKILNTWRKARENVENLVEADRKQREHFRQEVGEFLPTDLWVGMHGPLKRWELVEEGAGSEIRDGSVTLTLGKSAVKGKGVAR